MSTQHARGLFRTAAVVVALALLLTATGCASAGRQRVTVAAEYVRSAVNADFGKMAHVVTSDARPYCFALDAMAPDAERMARVESETWKGEVLTFELKFGPASTYLRLSPPTKDAPDEVRVKSWNKAGNEASGVITVREEKGKLVVTAVDGKPIDEVLSMGGPSF